MSDRPASDAEGPSGETERTRPAEHLADLPDGSGCTEIWEHLSERRPTEEE